MSIEDHLKPIGTLSKKSTLLDGDKIVIYPADFPLAPVGAEFTTIGDLNTGPEEAAGTAQSTADAALGLAIQPARHMHFTIVAQPTTISAVTKKVIRVPEYLVGYKVAGISLHTFATNGETPTTGKVTVGAADATKLATIAAGAYSNTGETYGGKPDDGYITLALDDEIAVAVTAGSGGSGLEAVVSFAVGIS